MRADEMAEEFADPVFTRLADVKATRVTWLWQGRIPLGKLTVLDGDPSLGKSTLMTDIAARVTTGAPMPGEREPTEPRSVLLLSAEDGVDDTIRPRFDAADGDSSRVYVFDGIQLDERTMRPPSIPTDLDHLELKIRNTGADLVVIDVLSAFLGSHVDSYRDQDVRGALMPLAKVAERTGAAVVVLRHLSKTGGTNALYRGGGSIGIIGAARSGLLVAVDPEDDSRRILASTKCNVAVAPPAMAYRLVSDDVHGCGRIAWEGETTHKASDLLVTGDEEERTARDDAAEFLVDLLADGPVTAKHVLTTARAAGHAEKTIKRAKKKLGVESYREGFGVDGVWWWRIVEGHTEPIEAVEGQPNGVAPIGLLSETVALNGQAF